MTKDDRKNPTLKYPLVLTAMFTTLSLMVGGYFITYHFYLGVERDRVSERATLYRNELIGALERFQHLPYILSRDPAYLRAIQYTPGRNLNLKLKDFATRSGVDAIYLMDRTGQTIAASNADQTPTFLGQNYAFRPYFRNALEGKNAEFYAIGATTSIPGYFIAQGVRDVTGDTVGVLAVKLSLDQLVHFWRDREEYVYVTDINGIVVLSSVDAWQYKSTVQLSDEILEKIRSQKQFGKEQLRTMPIKEYENAMIRLGNTKYLSESQALGRLGWKLHYQVPLNTVIRNATSTFFIFVTPVIIFLAAYLAFSSWKIRAALAQSRQDSDLLRGANLSLEQEVEERRATEVRLEQTQRSLKQASKLAALGQLSASVSHELGQPISALQNYVASAYLPDTDVGADGKHLFERISRIIKRISQISKQLRFFAQPGEDQFAEIDLAEMIVKATQLRLLDLDVNSANLIVSVPDKQYPVYGNRLRLEQVLINLVRNSMDAVREMDTPKIEIKLAYTDRCAVLSVLDNGVGIDTQQKDSILDPFYTTKPSGEGLGLGLAISSEIIKDHGGEMIIGSSPDGGAKISMKLPLIKAEVA